MSDKFERLIDCENTLEAGPAYKEPAITLTHEQFAAAHNFSNEYWRCMTSIGEEMMLGKLRSLMATTEQRIAKSAITLTKED